MKKYIYAFIATVCLPFSTQAQVAINETNFPDDNFRAVVAEYFDKADETGAKDGVLSAEEIATASNGYQSGRLMPNWIVLENKGISNLKGIEYFTATTYLQLYKNKLTSLDVSALTNLEQLWVGSSSSETNKMTTLDISNNTKLKSFRCVGLGLTELDVSNNLSLETLLCNNNKLTTIDVAANTNLSEFNCSDNDIKTLNVKNNKKLKSLKCDHCGLSELDVTENTGLQTLYCEGAISKKDIDNYLTELNVSNNTNLTSLRCGYNDITEIDVSMLTKLKEFVCRSNQLTQLNVSNNTALTNLNCNSNHLTTLDLSKCTKLTTIDVDGQKVECDAFVLDKEKIAIEVTPSFNENDFTTDMFTNLSNGEENTFNFTDGEQEYIYDAETQKHYLVIAKPTVEKDIDLRNQVVKYEFDVQNPKDETATMRVTVTIPYPYIMYINPLTETTIKEVGDANVGGIAESETFYSGTIFLDYTSFVPEDAGCYAAESIREDSQDDMLHEGTLSTFKQLNMIEVSGQMDNLLPENCAAYVKATESGYYPFSRIPKDYYVNGSDLENAQRIYDKENNLLQGTLEDLPVEYQTVLTLGREQGIGDGGTGVVGFWRYRGETVAAHRAYIDASVLTGTESSGDVKGLVLNFNNDATGIRQIESNEKSGAWYNLQGMQIASPVQKGIYIQNGKKIIVR